MLMEKRINVVKHFEKGIPVISAEAVPLEQVFLNLINNAIAALEPGGTLILETCWDVYKDKVQVTIRDTGTGIKPEHRDRVFEPFFSTKKPGEGTGLGLGVCENIVTSYGGSISMVSKTVQEDPENQGTTFTLTFPVRHSGSPPQIH